MAETISLRQRVLEFLDEHVLSKQPEDRTQRDEALLEHGRAFADVLLRHEAARGGITEKPQPHEVAVTKLLKGYNEINREYDLRGVDADLAGLLRRGKE